jgi:hypothetical protein
MTVSKITPAQNTPSFFAYVLKNAILCPKITLADLV